MYVMSDKAVGWDWKLRKNNRLTLRIAMVVKNIQNKKESINI